MWNENLNVVFLREVLFDKPYQFRSGTKESAGCWVKLVAKLTGDDYKVYGFVGNPKSFRDHFNNRGQHGQNEVSSQRTCKGMRNALERCTTPPHHQLACGYTC